MESGAGISLDPVLLTMTMFVFVWLVKPTWKQLGILTVLFSLYSLFVRYMLSGMPEVICFSLLILFYGLAMSYLKKESRGKLIAMFVISVLLTLMRPYMLLFLALAAACMALCGKALAKPYLRLLTLEPGRAKAEYRAKTQKKQPPRRALLRR